MLPPSGPPGFAGRSFCNPGDTDSLTQLIQAKEARLGISLWLWVQLLAWDPWSCQDPPGWKGPGGRDGSRGGSWSLYPGRWSLPFRSRLPVDTPHAHYHHLRRGLVPPSPAQSHARGAGQGEQQTEFSDRVLASNLDPSPSRLYHRTPGELCTPFNLSSLGFPLCTMKRRFICSYVEVLEASHHRAGAGHFESADT